MRTTLESHERIVYNSSEISDGGIPPQTESRILYL